MSERTKTCRGEFGDGEHDFRLDLPQLYELEEKTGAGFGAVAKRVFNGDYYIRDLEETVRLGLIGGGMPANSALAFRSRYIVGTPVVTLLPVAVAILEAAMFGVPQDGDDD